MASAQDTTIELDFAPRTKLITLTRGYVTLVDEDMYDELMQWKWRVLQTDRNPRPYVIRSDSERGHVLMHRYVAGATAGLHVDHINRDSLDNRRCNLRLCTPGQNAYNRKKRCDAKTTSYKGVHRVPGRDKWRATLTHNKKLVHIGYFATEEQAAKAFDDTARRLHGEFAVLNFPNEYHND